MGQPLPHPLTKYSFSGQPIPISRVGYRRKGKIFVLTANKNSFESFIALGLSNEERSRNEIVFVEKQDDMDVEYGQLQVRILDDFFIHPRFSEILIVLQGRLWVTATPLTVVTPNHLVSG